MFKKIQTFKYNRVSQFLFSPNEIIVFHDETHLNQIEIPLQINSNFGLSKILMLLTFLTSYIFEIRYFFWSTKLTSPS